MVKHSPQHQKAQQSGRRRPPQPRKQDMVRQPVKPLTPEDIAWVKSMIVYEDDLIMGFNKPSGLSSQGGRGDGLNLDDMMFAFARSNGKRPNLIHRLDRDTSGILLVAKNHPATSFLGKALARRAFAKTYLCIVSNPKALPDRGTIEVPLRRDEIGRESYSRVCAPDHPDAQGARTDFETLSRTADAALVKCSPYTGRMHQIRVHLAHLGAPIAGDARYGGALSVDGFPVRRLMLHALSLTFPHPAGGEKTLTALLPEDMAELCRGLGLAIPPSDQG